MSDMNDDKQRAGLFELANRYGTATVYEALKIDCMVDPAIKTIWRGAKIAAPAYPLQCSPQRQPGDPRGHGARASRQRAGGRLRAATWPATGARC